MSNVVSLDDHRPHCSGTARCLDCRHEWEAVAPVAVEWMECPKCSLVRGRFVYYFWREEDPYFECGCGNDLFTIYHDGLMCPNCGKEVVLPEGPPPGGNDVPPDDAA